MVHTSKMTTTLLQRSKSLFHVAVLRPREPVGLFAPRLSSCWTIEMQRNCSSLLAMNNHNKNDNNGFDIHEHNGDKKHCPTCHCQSNNNKPLSGSAAIVPVKQDEELPPPLPEPKYSVLKRVLSLNLVALSSPLGRERLLHALQTKIRTANNDDSDATSTTYAESYWSLMEHFTNQSDPAYCGVTTLMIVLNSLAIDPNIRWRGGWRYFGDEDVLLHNCCLSSERIRRIGISMEEFQQLAKCHGLSSVVLKRPIMTETTTKSTTTEPATITMTNIKTQQQQQHQNYSLDDFRTDVKSTMSRSDMKLVVSFARHALHQTGEGHFSPIAAYHEPTDSVLLLDVARFKYPPYWVSVEELYHAMIPKDTVASRGWFLMTLSGSTSSTQQQQQQQQQQDILIEKQQQQQQQQQKEYRRPAHLVPQVGEPDICPIGKVKVEFCKSNPNAMSATMTCTTKTSTTRTHIPSTP